MITNEPLICSRRGCPWVVMVRGALCEEHEAERTVAVILVSAVLSTGIVILLWLSQWGKP